MTTVKRSSVAPDLLAEAGYPGFDVSSWQGIVVPASTPQEFGSYIAAEITRWKKVAEDAGVKPE